MGSSSLPLSRIEALVGEMELANDDGAPAVALASTPVHVLYGGAHLYRADAPAKLARLARASMDTYGSDDATFNALMGAAAIPELAARVREKLARDPVERMCIDFEDGYGLRADEEEDAEAIRAASELAKARDAGGGPIVGIRIKSLAAPTTRRAARTLDLFLTTLGAIPPAFTVTLPKVSRAQEVTALATLLDELEETLGVAPGATGMELMVETPRALLDEEGRVALPSLVRAARGRCRAVHLGAYDLTASLGVAATEQRLDHPACNLARLLMQLSLAGTSVTVVDGATTLLPTSKNASEVHDAWKVHASGIRSALALGIYQGWDLHPAQLPARYGAVFAFFLAEREAMTERLRAFVAKATQATRSGRVFDDAATGQGLLVFFVRGFACGALTRDDVVATGLTLDELGGRSFAKIVAARS